MRYKNIFCTISLTLVIGLVLIACSHDEISTGNNLPVKTENGMYVYPVDLNCLSIGYQDGNSTRAVSYEWKNGATIFIRIKYGSSFMLGYLLFDSEGGHLCTFGELQDTNETECHLAYFEDSNGDYFSLNFDTQCFDIYNNGKFVRNTSIPLNSDTISISEQTALFRTNEGTITSSNKYSSIKATLVPRTWRMRFSGDNGTIISLPKNTNDISYWNKWIWSTTEDSRILGNARTVRLTANNGYTPYIYGFFQNGVVNKITLINKGNTYTRSFDASYMSANSSGCFTIPTASNYASLGWTKQVLFEEPYVKWGATIATVKSEMATRGFELMEGSSNSLLLYKQKNQEDYTCYIFESDKLKSVWIDFLDYVTIEDVNTFIATLNGITFRHMSSDYVNYYSDSKTSSIIAVENHNGSVVIAYLRDDSNDLSVSPTSLDFTADGGVKTVNITSNTSWTASSNQAWVTVSPKAGTENDELTIKVSANTSTSPRNATVTISSGDTSKTIEIIQDGKSTTLSVSKTSLNFTEGGGSQSITVSSNESWTLASNQSWCTVSPSNGSNDGTITITVTANSSSARTAKVTVKGSTSGDSVEVSVSQDAGSDISRDEYGNDKEL